jgi:RimJ/RimL family protein N-acetyltransferase
MYLLDKTDFKIIVPIIKKHQSIHVTTYAQALLERPNTGKIYVDNPDYPLLAYFRYVYNPYIDVIIGNCNDENTFKSLAHFIKNTVLPETERIGHSICVIRSYPPNISSKLYDLLSHKKPLKSSRKSFNFNKLIFQMNQTNSLKRVPADTKLLKIDKAFLNKYNDKHLNDDLKENWLSINNYLQDGIGFALIQNNEVATFCFSFIASESFQEINIATKETYRCKGYASIVATAFIDSCLKTNQTPIWECDAANSNSVALANKLGFEEVLEFQETFINL